MIDKVTIFLDGNTGQKVDMDRLQGLHRTDENTANAHTGAMAVTQRLGGVYLRGSLAKYVNGENCTPLIRRQVGEAVSKLEAETGFDLSAAVVTGVEAGTAVIVKEAAARYLHLFGYPPGLQDMSTAPAGWKRG